MVAVLVEIDVLHADWMAARKLSRSYRLLDCSPEALDAFHRSISALDQFSRAVAKHWPTLSAAFVESHREIESLKAIHRATLEQRAKAVAVLQELLESAAYWSEYDVPLGIVDRIREAIAANESGVQP